MMELTITPLDITQLKLVRFDFNMDHSEIGETLFDVMSRDEQVWVYKMMLSVPNDSSSYPDDDVWDIFLTDDNLLGCVFHLFDKYSIDYQMVDISENYYRKDILLSDFLIDSINVYLNQNLTMDMVLDRINQVGINGINVFEKSYLEQLQVD